MSGSRSITRTILGVGLALSLAAGGSGASAGASDSRVTPTTVWGRAIPTNTTQIGGGQQVFSASNSRVYLSFSLVPNRLFALADGGALTLVAGTGSPTPSGDGGAATAAGVGQVRFAVEGPSQDVYLSDGVTVRKVAKATGVITTVAGGGSGGDGPATSADLGTITDLAVDTNGRIYVMTPTSLRKVVGGTISTVYTNHPGSGEPGEAQCIDLAGGSPRFGSLNSIALIGTTVRLSVSCDSLGAAIVSITSGGAVSEYLANASVSRRVEGADTVQAVAHSTSGACVLEADTTVSCFGQGGGTFLRTTQVMTAAVDPADPPVALTGVVELDAVLNGTYCARLGSGQVWCWGSNSNGVLGIGSTSPVSSALAVRAGSFTDAVELQGYFGTVCVRHTGGTVSCWGKSDNGDAGTGTFANVLTPTAVSGLSGVTALGSGSPCAIVSGAVWCWGSNFSGRLGVSPLTTSSSNVPVQVPGLTTATSVVSYTTYGTTCAQITGGSLRCWGYQTGIAAYTSTPTEPSGLGAVSDFAVGPRLGCAITSPGGQLKCWGDNGAGGLGTGAIGTSGTWVEPVDVAVTNPVEVSSGGTMCARDTSGDVFCWGQGFGGAVGDGQDGVTPLPVLVGPSNVTALVDSRDTARCVVVTDDLHCWGAVAQRSATGLQGLADGRLIGEAGWWHVIGADGSYTTYAGKGSGCSELAGTAAADVCVSFSDSIRPNGALVLTNPLAYTGVASNAPTTLTVPARAPDTIPDGVSATSLIVADTVRSIAVKPDGTLLVAQWGSSKVHTVAASGASAGKVVTLVGDGVDALDGLGGPALQASIPSVLLSTDTTGRLHLLADDEGKSMKLANGKLLHVAGNGTNGNGADGSPATTSALSPFSIAAADDGSQYLAGYNAGFTRWVIRKVSPSGILSTVYTSPVGESVPTSMALAPDGTLVVTRTLNPSGNVVERIRLSNRKRSRVTLPSSLVNVGPLEVTVDGANTIVVAVRTAYADQRLVTISRTGTVRTLDPATGGDALAIDRAGNLFVARGATIVRYAGVVDGRPAAPTAPLTPRASSPRTGRAKVTWATPTGDGFRSITDYVVQRRRVGTARWVAVRDGRSTTRVVVVTGLPSGSRFQFRVLAVNAIGRSVASALTAKVTIR